MSSIASSSDVIILTPISSNSSLEAWVERHCNSNEGAVNVAMSRLDDMDVNDIAHPDMAVGVTAMNLSEIAGPEIAVGVATTTTLPKSPAKAEATRVKPYEYKSMYVHSFYLCVFVMKQLLAERRYAATPIVKVLVGRFRKKRFAHADLLK
jgi:hypothetical protein